MPGIYIHIPFCKQACHYCNFHFSTSLRQKEDIIAAIVKEINLTENEFISDNNIFETIYFGGGTPSLLDIGDISSILEVLYNRFSISTNAEITLEANPDDISEEKLSSWKKMGINRFSVGIQSFVEADLRWMNRVHSVHQALSCIDMIRNAGFDNFSADLIYGSPVLTNDQWKHNVEILINKGVPHISCYALTVETGTALEKMIGQKKKEAADGNKQADQFHLLMNWMNIAGYEHYEISNYALPGYRSRHNSSYWQQKQYLGFGPAAHSYNGTHRRWNINNNALYIRSLLKENLSSFEEETLTQTQQLNEYLMTSLRTIEGTDLDYIRQVYGESSFSFIRHQIKKWASKVDLKGNKLFLTNEGKLFADGIAADLFQ